MPPVFGGSPLCPTCNKAVYFAEKVIGPGGTLYHKPCLKCNECGKSLEPRLLVDHDGMAYCKACHGKLFGTKGYGAGGALVGEYAPRPTPPSSPQKPPSVASPRQTPSFGGNRDSFASPARPPAVAAPSPVVSAPVASPPPVAPARRPLPVPPIPAPKPPSIPTRPSFASSSGPEPDAAASDPAHSIPTAPLAERESADVSCRSVPDFDETDVRTTSISASSLPPAPASNPNAALLSRDLCPRCQTVVYHAESVSALSRKWHKRCLRCAGCGTTLMPNRLDERDGEPWCRKCYTDNFGLKGGMGVMTRPNLF